MTKSSVNNQGRTANTPAVGPGSVSNKLGQQPTKPGDDPTIRPAKSAGPATKGTTPATPAVDPFVYWDTYYKSHTEQPIDVFSTVAPLMKQKKFDQAEAALKSYLRYQPKQAQAWMYEWLIKSIESRKGSDAEINQGLGYAAMLAKRTKNPDDLVRVADMMVLRNLYGSVGDPGYESNIGELIDLAAEKIPSSAYPPMMSVNLATKTKDSKRMATAADRLLSLGWPGVDDKIRRDLSQQVELLEKSLRDDGKPGEADDLARKVAESEIRDVYISIKWTGEADIDLAVEEPLGATCRYDTPRTVFGGAIVKAGVVKQPEEVYVCPRGFDGDYVVRIDPIYNNPADPVKEVVVTAITHEGGANEKRQETKISLDKSTPVKIHLDGGRRKEVLPFIAPTQPEALAGDRKRARKATLPEAANAPKAVPKSNRPIPIQ